MEQTINLGKYTLTLVGEDDFADVQVVSQSISLHAQQRSFKWAMARQKWFFMYVVKLEDDIICRLELKTVHGKVFELSYEINPNFRNLGHCQEIVRRVIDYMRDNMDAIRVQATVSEHNKPSNAVCKRTQFSLECVLKSYGTDVNGDPCNVNLYSVIF
jgi:RimJ/RimL family protein N-acetyltransferase